MVREFSEEKREEIFRALDEIDNREWKSFMEWCGSGAEEFGDWPDKLAVSAYTRYVDKYHERVLEINEMTRNRVNTVFENVAEIDARYAGRMKECQLKIKEQIAMVNTMTEFMQSMTDGNPNMALIAKGSVNESIRTEEEVELTVTSSDDAKNETSIYFLNDYFDSGEEFDRKEILRILESALHSGDITQDEYDNLKASFTEIFELKEKLIIYETLRILKGTLLSADISRWKYNDKNILFTGMVELIDKILEDEEEIQNLYNEIEIKLKKEYNRIVAGQRTMVTLCDPLVAYSGYPQVEDFDHTIQLGDVNNPYDPVYTDAAQGNQQANCYRVDMTERDTIVPRGWFSFMYRNLDQMEEYYSGTNILGCERSKNGLVVTLDNQKFLFHLENGWWMDENGRYLITVGPNVLLTEYGKNGDYSLGFNRFSDYFGRRIDVILVNDENQDDILTLECIYGGDIKAHTEGPDNGVYMTGRSWLDINDTATADGSIVEFIGMPNDDNGIMSNYHVELIIVYDNAAEVN